MEHSMNPRFSPLSRYTMSPTWCNRTRKTHPRGGQRKPGRPPLGVERLEGRDLPSVTISVSDAMASEGSDLARLVDVPISSGSSPVDSPKSIAQGPNGDYFVANKYTNSVLR